VEIYLRRDHESCFGLFSSVTSEPLRVKAIAEIKPGIGAGS
jgi:hypothetical protein